MSNVFAAVADPTRRDILERLRKRGALSISEIADGMPMTRQAVTKHLRILEASGLTLQRKKGRERLHELSGRPLREVSDWLAPYEAEWDERLDRLRTHLSTNPSLAGEEDDDDGRDDDD